MQSFDLCVKSSALRKVVAQWFVSLRGEESAVIE